MRYGYTAPEVASELRNQRQRVRSKTSDGRHRLLVVREWVLEGMARHIIGNPSVEA